MKTLIFDFDGTLADSFKSLLAVFEEIINRPQKLTTAEVEALRGKSPNEVIKYLRIKRWQIPRLVIRGRRLAASKISEINAFPGLDDVVSRLHTTGFQMFVVSTNSPENIRKFLAKNGLESYFTRIYGNVGLLSKAAALRKIVKKERLKAADCFYICDEVRDVQAAHKAKIPAVAVSWGFNFPSALNAAKPHAVARNPKALLEILE